MVDKSFNETQQMASLSTKKTIFFLFLQFVSLIRFACASIARDRLHASEMNATRGGMSGSDGRRPTHVVALASVENTSVSLFKICSVAAV